MPRPRKYVETVVKSFSVELQVYVRLKQALAFHGRSLSEEVNELLKKRLAELEGSQPTAQEADYEALKRQHTKLMEETIRLQRLLEKTGACEELKSLAEEQGLDTQTLNNIKEVAAKILKAPIPQNQKAPIHLFITLLETAKQRRNLEQKLEEIRLKETEQTIH